MFSKMRRRGWIGKKPNEADLPKAKKRCSGHRSSTSSDGKERSLAATYTEIRRQVVRWQQKLKIQELKTLKEHDHYEIKVKQVNESVLCSLHCKMCGSNYALANDGKYYRISNWTKHVKKCFMARNRSLGSKGRLDHYMNPSGSSCQPEASASGDCLSPSYSPQEEQHEFNMSGDGEEATDDQEQLSNDVVLVDDNQTSLPANQHFRLSPPPVEEGEMLH